MQSLQQLIKRLESNSDINSVFLTGSMVTKSVHKNSDIDLVVILNENSYDIRSVFEIIDGMFADIYFFSRADLESLLNKSEVVANSFDGILLSWIASAHIEFDKSGILKSLQERCGSIKMLVTEDERNSILQKISYNFFHNNRYYSADDELYHQALEIRLMYSLSELITGYLLLRNIPWRGEKHAINFIRNHDPTFYSFFTEYVRQQTLKGRIEIYKQMVRCVCPADLSIYDYAQPVALSSKHNTSRTMNSLREYWKTLSSKSIDQSE